jgi:aldose 1-epimerase
MLNIDGDQISIAIDLDQGGRLASLQWRDMEFVTPFAGDVLNWGWYAMAPWVGRIKDGLITNSKQDQFQLPTTFMPPHAINGFGFFSSWQDLGAGKQLLELPPPFAGAQVIQSFEVLDDGLRWCLEYEDNGCDLPFSLGFHPWLARDIGKSENAVLSFSANQILLCDNDYVPSGKFIKPTQSDMEKPLDDTFAQSSGVAEIVWAGAVRMRIESDAPYWQINTQDETGICIQPMSTPPNGHLLGITGEPYIEALFTFTEDF